MAAFFPKIWLLLFTLIAFNVSFAARIFYPGGSAPAIVMPADTLGIIFSSTTAPDSVILRGDWISYKTGILKTVIGHHVFDSLTLDSATQIIYVRIPETICNDLFSLAVYTNGAETVSNRSVKTINTSPSLWHIVHITDPHVTAAWDSASTYAGELEYLAPLIRLINIISPEFVICSGDNVMDNLQNNAPPQAEKWNQFFNGHGIYKGLHSLNSPLFLSTGNHDAQWPNGTVIQSRQWTTFAGLRYHAMRFGYASFLFWDVSIGKDDTTIQKRWFKQWLDSTGRSGIRISVLHEPGKINTKFHNDERINIALAGHTHSNTATEVGTTPTRLYITGSASHHSYVGVSNIGWLRLISFRDSSLVLNQVFQFGNTSAKTENLAIHFESSNNGTAESNKAVIYNRLSSVTLPPVKVRFIMRKGEYTLSSGTILQMYSNDTATIIDTRIAVPRNDSITLSISTSNSSESAKSIISKNTFSAYPNPSSSMSTINFLVPEKHGHIEIFDITGKLVNRIYININGSNIVWNWTDKMGETLPMGIYTAIYKSNTLKISLRIVKS